MLKWRRRRRKTTDCVDAKGSTSDASSISSFSDQGSSDEKDVSQFSSEGEQFSPYEDFHLDDLFKKFRTHNMNPNSLAELENCLEQQQNSLGNSPSNNNCRPFKPRQKSLEKLRSPSSLPSIYESDELLSIADSGISCDADDELDTTYGNGIDLLTSINETIFREKENNSNIVRSHSLPRPCKIISENIDDLISSDYLASTWGVQRNSSKSKTLPRKPQKHFANEDLYSSPSKNKFSLNNNYLNKYHRSKSMPGDLDDLEKLYDEGSKQLKEEDSEQFYNSLQELVTPEETDELENSLQYEKEPTHLLDIMEPQNHKEKLCISRLNSESQSHLASSSMLWSGETSKRPPSTAEIYSTMPPNRYEERSKDFMTQLKSVNEEEQNQTTPAPREFKVNLDVSHYAPEEILVTLEDGKLVVNGKHFSESEYGFESCQFHRKYPIPPEITKSDIKSKISEDGILTITGKQKMEIMCKPETGQRQSNYENVDGICPVQTKEKLARELTEVIENTSVQATGNLANEPTEVIENTSDDGTSESSFDDLKPYVDNQFQDVDGNSYLLKVDCKYYNPEELDVRISRGELVIQGKQSITVNEGGEDRIRHSEFTRRFSIPKDADINTVCSRLIGGETLHVECGKKETSAL